MSERAWARVGQLGTVAAGVSGLAALAIMALSPRAGLEAVVQSAPYHVPTPTAAALGRLIEYPDLRDTIRATVDSVVPGLPTPERSDIAWAVTNKLKVDRSRVLPDFQTLTLIDVRNNGRRAAAAVALTVPNGTYLEIERTGQPLESRWIAGVAELATLRPREAVSLRVWGGWRISGFDNDKFVLSHSAGVGKVSFEEAAPGWAAALARIAATPSLWIPLVLLCGWLLVLGLAAFARPSGATKAASFDPQREGQGDEVDSGGGDRSDTRV